MVTRPRKQPLALRRTKSSPPSLATSPTPPPDMSAVPHLERGKACLRCRGRKMRCDGARPTCGQCVRAEVGDCEYTDSGPTASQILEQNVAQLEARIRELTEGNSVDSVTLHRPQGFGASSSAGSSARFPSPTSPNLLRTFLTFAPGFGFFLHVSRFLNNFKASLPPSSRSPLPESLVYVVLLIETLFSNDPARATTEQQYLSLVMQNLSADLDPRRILYTLQTEVLLSYYLFHKDRRVEGGYHAAAAVSIAVACSLHKIRSSRNTHAAISLAPCIDEIDEGERINAFWTVFVLDRCWTVWMQSPSVLIDETSASTQVDTPWPLDMVAYEQRLMPHGNFGNQSVQGFLAGDVTDNDHQSLLALRAKASVLYEKSAQVAARWSPHSPGFQSQFVALDTRIEQFRASLPSLSQAASMRPDVVRALLAIHTLCYCATIQLHSPFAQNHQPSNSKVSAAANGAATILQAIPMPQITYVDPIMGVLWESIGRILKASLQAWQRSSRGSPPPPAALAVKTSLDLILASMQVLSGGCPLIANELTKLHAA